MRRFTLAIVVASLAFSVSDVSALVIAEPCTVDEQPGQDEGGCPPTCVTCGCCARAVEALPAPLISMFQATVAAGDFLMPRLPASAPRDILHVPKLPLA